MHFRRRTLPNSNLWQLSHRLPLAACKRAVDSAGTTNRAVPVARGAVATPLFLAFECFSRLMCVPANRGSSMVTVALMVFTAAVKSLASIPSLTDVQICTPSVCVGMPRVHGSTDQLATRETPMSISLV